MNFADWLDAQCGQPMRWREWLLVVGLFLYCFLCTLNILLAFGQNPPTTVDLAKAKLVWTFTLPAGVPLDKFVLRCGPSSGNWTVLKDVPIPAARSFFIKDIPLTTGTWTCIVHAQNAYGSGGPSPEVTFQAGQTPSKVDTLVIQE